MPTTTWSYHHPEYLELISPNDWNHADARLCPECGFDHGVHTRAARDWHSKEDRSPVPMSDQMKLEMIREYVQCWKKLLLPEQKVSEDVLYAIVDILGRP